MLAPRRRFTENAPPHASRLRSLEVDHPAIVAGRTLFPSTVVEPENSPRLLISGANQRKLGDRVVKGAWRGFPIYALTLEERATCPQSCHHWRDCYGNAMHFARRHRHGRALIERLGRELAEKQREHPKGFVARLHILGDFYSVEYVDQWLLWLEEFPALHVFGYTAWRPETEIGRAVAALSENAWHRFAVRFSHVENGPMRAVTLPPGEPSMPGVITCPAQTAATGCCGTCGLCWAEAAKDRTIGFIPHGMARGTPEASSGNDGKEAPPHDPGPKPDLGWLPVARLFVDERYQRTLEGRRSQKLIARLVEKFNWSAFQAIVATEREGGWWIIDGQHRVEAARRRGETHVPAVVVKAVSVEEQAAIFVQANQDRVAVNPFALFYARLASGDPKARAVEEFCERMGLSIPRLTVPLRHLKPGQTLALKAIERIALDPDDKFGRQAIKLLLECWPNDPGGVSALLLKATAGVLSEFYEHREQIKLVLSKQAPLVWTEEYSGAGGADQLREDLRSMIDGNTEAEVAVEPVRTVRGFVHPFHNQVNPERHAFVRDGKRLVCASQEWTVFEAIAEKGGRLVSADAIFNRLYGDDPDGGADPKIIDVLVCRLRKKCPFEIETVWGEGYILNGYKMEKTALVAPAVSGIDRAKLMAGR